MFTLISSTYGNGESIPLLCAHRSVAGGRNLSPEYSWTDPPSGAKSFALSIVDPHPVANNWVHWLLVNIPLRARSIPAGASRSDRLPQGSKETKNSFNETGYGGPAPPKGSGAHPYIATLYALNVTALTLAVDVPLSKFLREIEGKVMAEATMVGYFERA